MIDLQFPKSMPHQISIGHRVQRLLPRKVLHIVGTDRSKMLLLLRFILLIAVILKLRAIPLPLPIRPFHISVGVLHLVRHRIIIDDLSLVFLKRFVYETQPLVEHHFPLRTGAILRLQLRNTLLGLPISIVGDALWMPLRLLFAAMLCRLGLGLLRRFNDPLALNERLAVARVISRFEVRIDARCPDLSKVV